MILQYYEEQLRLLNKSKTQTPDHSYKKRTFFQVYF